MIQMSNDNNGSSNQSRISHPLRRVAVLYGGRSAERDVSLNTGTAVANALQRQNCFVDLIDWVGRDSIARLLSENYDCAFIALHGIDGEDGSVQALLEILQIPYTGSGILASALCMDKVRTKHILRAHGLPVLDDITITKNILSSDNIDLGRIINLGLPLCLKPIQQGSSIGIHKVEHKDDLADAVADVLKYGDAMAEQWLIGKEYTVGFLNNKPLPSIWIEAKQKFYNYDAKYLTHDTNYHCPSGLSHEQEAKIQALAQKAFDVTGCHDWARIDFITDSNGEFYILEVNTVPGLTSTSLVPKAALKAGISFDALVLQITMNASLKQIKQVAKTSVSSDKQAIF